LIVVYKYQIKVYICVTKANNMKQFIVVLQESSNKFGVRFFEGATSKSIYPLYREFGVAIAIFEDSIQNEKYCRELANSLSY
jgi:hypothetical protein